VDEVVGDVDALERLVEPVAAEHVALDERDVDDRAARGVAGQAAQVVAVALQARDERAADVSGDAGQENVHVELIRVLEEKARGVLPASVYDYYAGGAGEEQTLAENVEAWRKVWLRPRGLVDVTASIRRPWCSRARRGPADRAGAARL
jgi:hypothetical protein